MIKRTQTISPLIKKLDCELAHINLNGKTIIRQVQNELYQLSSIADYCNSNAKEIGTFLKTHKFNLFLNFLDKHFTIPEYVCLIEKPHGIKIGRTYNIKKQYNLNSENSKLKRLTFVKYIDRCENALKKAFGKYPKSKGVDTFKVDLETAQRIYDRVVEQYKIDEPLENNHIIQYNHDKVYGSGIYVSPEVMTILLSVYGNKSIEEASSDIEIAERAAATIDKNNYASLIKEEGNEFIYWNHGKCIIIINKTTKQVNLSKLWTSASEINGRSKMDLNKFLLRKPLCDIIEKYPETAPVSKSYKKRPLLNGRYAPIEFIHFVFMYLDIKYAYDIGNYVTDNYIRPPSKSDSLRYEVARLFRESQAALAKN